MPRPFLISASPTSTPRNSVTLPNHPHDPEPSDISFSQNSTPDLAQAIMLMTQELRLHESPKIPTPKLRAPDTFDGSEPHKLNNFILLCNLHFRRNSAFSHDDNKVTFAISHLRGTALEFFEPIILDPSETPDWLYDWSAFVSTLRTHFGPSDPIAEAENDIDNLKMSENQRIVKYNVKFNRLAIKTGWDDSVLRHRYYSGLSERIKDIIGQQGKPSTLAAMKNLAHSIDSRHWERLREKSRSENSTLHSAIDLHDSENSDPNNSNSDISDSEISDPCSNSEISDSEIFDSNISDSENSDSENSDSRNSVSENSNSDSEFCDSRICDSDSENSDSEHSDSDFSVSENSNSEKFNLRISDSDSENSDSEHSNSDFSDSENSNSDNSNSGNSESDDSGSYSE